LKHRTIVSTAKRPRDARRSGSGPQHLLAWSWSALSRLSRRQHVALAVCLVALVAWIDLVTGEQLSVSIFYAGPVFLLTWFVSRRAGVAGAILCAAIRLALALGTDSTVPKLIAVWNTDVELGLFLLCAFAFGTLKEALDREQALSQTDQLTGVASRRAFFDRLRLEIERSRRDGSTMTLAYVDLDDFKVVNDRLGHAAGDAVLRRTAQQMVFWLRATDFVARIGGDEFAILLPRTDAEAGRRLLTELRSRLLDSTEVAVVSLSVGTITFGPTEDDVDELLGRADEQMYRVKSGGERSISVEDRTQATG
jgi:diguanylate cyclase (GGDEF)-like protein